MEVWDMQYEFDDERCTYNELIRFHREYVGGDYPFEEWFRDHIACGVIKPVTSDYDSDRGKRTDGGWRVPDNNRNDRRDNISVMSSKSSGSMADEGRYYFRKLHNLVDPRNNREEYKRYLVSYEKICRSYDPIRTEPLIKKKLAAYFRGEYYWSGNELILAEKAYQEALVVWAPKETTDILPDGKIKFRLLQIYFAQENFGQTIPLLEDLLAAIRNSRKDCGLSEDDVYDLYTIKCYTSERSLGHDELAALKNMLATIHRDILGRNFHELAKLSDKRLTFVLVSIMMLVGNHYASLKECGSYQQILDYVKANKDILLAGDDQEMLMLDAYDLILKEMSS